MAILLTLLAMHGLSLGWIYWRRPAITRWLLEGSIKRTGGWRWLGLAVLLAISLYVVNLFGAWLLVGRGVTNPHRPLIDATSVPVLIILMVVVGPVFEEIIYRGLVFPALQTRFDGATAMMLTAGAFSLAHVTPQNWHYYANFNGMYLCLFGTVLCVLRDRSGSIWPCVVLHSTHNLCAIFGVLHAIRLGF